MVAVSAQVSHVDPLSITTNNVQQLHLGTLSTLVASLIKNS